MCRPRKNKPNRLYGSVCSLTQTILESKTLPLHQGWVYYSPPNNNDLYSSIPKEWQERPLIHKLGDKIINTKLFFFYQSGSPFYGYTDGRLGQTHLHSQFGGRYTQLPDGQKTQHPAGLNHASDINLPVQSITSLLFRISKRSVNKSLCGQLSAGRLYL